jgi:hypothetical protein
MKNIKNIIAIMAFTALSLGTVYAQNTAQRELIIYGVQKRILEEVMFQRWIIEAVRKNEMMSDSTNIFDWLGGSEICYDGEFGGIGVLQSYHRTNRPITSSTYRTFLYNTTGIAYQELPSSAAEAARFRERRYGFKRQYWPAIDAINLRITHQEWTIGGDLVAFRNVNFGNHTVRVRLEEYFCMARMRRGTHHYIYTFDTEVRCIMPPQTIASIREEHKRREEERQRQEEERRRQHEERMQEWRRQEEERRQERERQEAEQARIRQERTIQFNTEMINDFESRNRSLLNDSLNIRRLQMQQRPRPMTIGNANLNTENAIRNELNQTYSELRTRINNAFESRYNGSRLGVDIRNLFPQQTEFRMFYIQGDIVLNVEIERRLEQFVLEEFKSRFGNFITSNKDISPQRRRSESSFVEHDFSLRLNALREYLNRFEEQPFYGKLIGFIIETNRNLNREWRRNGRFFETQIEFYNAYMKPNYRDTLRARQRAR